MPMIVENNEKENINNLIKLFLSHGFKESQLLPKDPNQRFCSDEPRPSNGFSPESGLTPMKKTIHAQVKANRIKNKRKNIRKASLQIRIITI